jgi:hypothetical protein
MKECATPKIEKFFREINNGALYGSQSKLARDINSDTARTNGYYDGSKVPSEKHIKKMSERYEKTEGEIKDIFGIREKISIRQNARHINNHNVHGDQIVH